MSKVKQEFNYIQFIQMIPQIILTLAKQFGFDSQQVQAIRKVIDELIIKCDKVIKEGNDELMDYMKKKMLEKDNV